MNSHVADLMADKKRAIGVRSFVLCADRAALLVEDGAAAIESGIAWLEECQLNLKVLDRSFDERQRFERVGSACHELIVQP